jgi:hypothetical protein
VPSLADSPPPAEGQPGYYPDPLGGKFARYWDGTQWTSRVGREMQQATVAVSQPQASLSTKRVSEKQRKAILAQQLQQATVRGLRIESQSDFQAVMIEGQKVNHVLHAVLTVFTCFLWGIVWAIIAGTGGEKREMILVDEYGNVQHQRLGKI